ncbi:MAG: carbohydrate-binding protein [Chthonomonadaceae bacterium]|nr:carbohydrate-binding protein [Chthonomonadaceae bacterium]
MLGRSWDPRKVHRGGVHFGSGGMLSRGATRKRLAGVVALGIATSLAASGCGGALSAKANGDKKVAFSFLYSEIPAAPALKRFARDRAQQRGYTLLTDNIQGGKVDEQIPSVASFISQKVKAMTVQVQDPSAYGGMMRRAHGAGIKFVTYVAPAPGQDASILFPLVPAARQLSADAAKWINQHLGGKGEVLLMTLTSDPTSRAASTALGATIERETHAKVVASQQALDQATGVRVTQTALRAHPHLNVVLAWNDGGALGAAQVFKQRGMDPKKIYVASNEASQQGLQAVKDGNLFLKTLNVLSIKALGQAVADVPIDLAEGKKTGGVNIPHVLVHPGDTAKLAGYLAEYR